MATSGHTLAAGAGDALEDETATYSVYSVQSFQEKAPFWRRHTEDPVLPPAVAGAAPAAAAGADLAAETAHPRVLSAAIVSASH